MKVLMTADTVGGVLAYAVQLTQALCGSDVEIVLATMGGPMQDARRGALLARQNVRLHESNYALEWMEDPWDDVQAAGRWLMDLQEAERPDIIHLNGYAHGAWPWQAPVLIVGHSCVCSWYEAVRGEPAPKRWDSYRRATTAGLKAADVVVAPSGPMLAALNQHYGPLTNTRVIANARDPRRYAPARKQPFILAAGRLWDEAKGLARLAAIAPEVAWPVRLAGPAQHPDGGSISFDNVQMLGSMSPAALAAEMARAAIYALPARYEPFGLGALEAGLSGCALVLGDIPTLREVWGDAALFVGDDDELRDALHRLIEDADLRQEYARRALARASRYTPARLADEYLSLYSQLVDHRNAPESPRTSTDLGGHQVAP